MRHLKKLVLFSLVFVFLTCVVAIGEEENNKHSAKELILLLFNSPASQVYETAHKLAEIPALKIEESLSAVPADGSPKRYVALLSVILPKGIMRNFEKYFKLVFGSNDLEARLALVDLLSYAVPVNGMAAAYGVLFKAASGDDISPLETIRMLRAGWMNLIYLPSANYLLGRNNFSIPNSIKQSIQAFLGGNQPEKIRAEAAVTLAEMGVDDKKVMALVKRVANDPTEIGKRARSVLLGHPIYDEIVRRSQLFYVDVDKLEAVRLSINASKGIAAGLDKHTAFFDPDEVKSWEETSSGEYGGIGAYVTVRDNAYFISRPFYNGPAYKVGLRSGDIITEVEGVEMRGNDINDLVRRLKGKPGTKVKIKAYRRGWTKAREFVLTRAKITVPNIHTAKLPGNIGYVRLDSFSRKATNQMKTALSEIKDWGCDGLVFDLRGNPGGGLQAAVEIVSMFIENNKLVVFEEGRKDFWPRQNHFSKPMPKFEKPVVILVNGFSASASEIVSGSLKDYKRVTLVGEKTYGKGSVQIVFWVTASNFTCQFKMTIAKYFLPKGECIHDVGIEPHIKVEPMEIQGWVFDEQAKLREEGFLNEYIEQLIATDNDLAYRLAENDYGDSSRYPGLQEWKKKTDTFLDDEMLRFVVNDELRRVVQDKKGEELACNPGSDIQLQAALIAVLRAADKVPEKMPDVLPFILLEQKRKAEAEHKMPVPVEKD